jgi:hydroxymethylpyrimidine pyrophosphatase-like HAD family hydrolase
VDQQQQQKIDEAAEEFAAAVRESYQALADRGASAQELNTELTQKFFNKVIENLRTQEEANRQLTKELADQRERQQEAVQALTQESVSTYMDFVNSAFSYYQAAPPEARKGSGEVRRDA